MYIFLHFSEVREIVWQNIVCFAPEVLIDFGKTIELQTRGWSPRDNQRWTTLFQRLTFFSADSENTENIIANQLCFRADQLSFPLNQRCSELKISALFQRTWKTSALISSVSELMSSHFLWISAVQNWKFQRCLRKNQLWISAVQHWFSYLWNIGFSALIQRWFTLN